MDYNKITIIIIPFQEWLRDILTAQLGEIGIEKQHADDTDSTDKRRKQISENQHNQCHQRARLFVVFRTLHKK